MKTLHTIALAIALLVVPALGMSSAPQQNCDAQFPGVYPVVPDCPEGQSRRASCVQAVQTGYQASWTNEIKPKLDEQCELINTVNTLQGNIDAFYQAIVANIDKINQLQPLCDQGHATACWEIDMLFAENQSLHDAIIAAEDAIEAANTLYQANIGVIAGLQVRIDKWYRDMMKLCCEPD